MKNPITVAALALQARESARLGVLRAKTPEQLVTAGLRFGTADRVLWDALSAAVFGGRHHG